jgi:hypothetical protein
MDVVGIFESATDQDRVVLLLELLGRQVKVKHPSSDVAAFA